MTKAPASAPLALTMGDPAGVGPELAARLWQDRDKLALPPFVFIGAPEALTAALPDVPYQVLDDVSEAAEVFAKAIPVLAVPVPAPVVAGEGNPANGSAVINAIDKAVELARAGAVSAIVTAPLHKALLYQAGFTAPGHTEYLARLCDLPDDASVMMLATEGLRVVPVTIHIALKDVAKKLTADAIIHAGRATAADLRDRFGIKTPRLAVAALNPHAGESGAMGMEEATHIQPAIWALKDDGIDVTGPLPADTLFHADARQNYDAVLCMYHDQALIPLKTLDFWGGVNITLGLPIIRTSPDHGTAFDLAGKGIARTDSMLAAIRMAAEMATTEEQA
ncbi:4-hydroxythreonine-4-phosphate dehydrogenase PdxA [Kordiimonas marina]|uniref:4-hydroxythreonine-4-phosphate dehydrogenase PdxA n=1 Tax=Kordiimonas marina TaxID=2872312 RepID=UPI001FF303DE|nr:4-hydroxythreonine-4-phosphate dehydrogenase PdxA [Kordiimonas marina]MCJ9428937.1 4-hydroxythreonine-4-phosphate dehydrogenase PdxA [Kordiimonas marina]